MKIIRCLLALLAIGSHSFRSLKKEYYAPICIDNMLLKAPMMGEDVITSAMAGVAWAVDFCSVENKNLIQYGRNCLLVLLCDPIVSFLTTANHEINGHAVRCREFDYHIAEIVVTPYKGGHVNFYAKLLLQDWSAASRMQRVESFFSFFGINFNLKGDALQGALTKNDTAGIFVKLLFNRGEMPAHSNDPLDVIPQIFLELNQYGSHVQEHIIITLAGMQANYMLSQKIIDDLFIREQSLDPVNAMFYIRAVTDQIHYIHQTKSGEKNKGNDIVSYIEESNLVYNDYLSGSNQSSAMTLDMLKNNEILSFFDPMLLISSYSIFTARNVKIPMIGNKQWGCLPFARSVLTPYGILEKKFGFYCRTPHTPLKFSVSFGSRRGLNSVDITDPKIASLVEFFRDHVKEAPKGAFSAGLGMLLPGESAPKATSWMFEMTVYKLYATDKLRIGGEFAVWKQPELFTARPLLSGSKNGGMGFIDATYAFSKGVDGIVKIGYKTQGFVQGLPIKKTFIARAGIGIKF